MEIVDRIKQIVEQEDISYRSFETSINKSNGYIKQVLEKKGSLPSVDVILTIIDKYPKYNLQWLMTGKGSMLNSSEDGEEKRKTPPEEVRLEEMISRKVLEDLSPFIGQMTDRVLEVVLDMGMTIDKIRSDQEDIIENQKKTHELIEKKG